MMALVHRIGIDTFLQELADYLEADFKRWSAFDKTPRIAAHSAEGVIELMPTSDSSLYGFIVCERSSEKHEGRTSDRYRFRYAC